MYTFKIIEDAAAAMEHFRIRFTKDGRDVRSDKVFAFGWPFDRMTTGRLTVHQFIEKVRDRFFGYDIEVLCADGSIAPGQMHLATVRGTYL